MSGLPQGMEIGRQVTLILRGVNRGHEGRILSRSDDWLELLTGAGVLWVRCNDIAAVLFGPGSGAEADDPDPPAGHTFRPRSLERPGRAGSAAPGRSWETEDLRRLADGFIAGETESALADRFHRTRTAIRELRQGFECARGAIDEDRCGPVARAWVERWRRLLSSA